MTDKFGCRILTGAEFDQAASEATYIDRIPSPYARNVPRPHGDIQTGIGRRHETRDKL